MAWATAAVAGIDAGSQMLQMQQQSNLNLANRTFSAQQAALNRNFQAGQQLQAEQYNTQMSDTALQRRMADAKAAGINPMLAVTTGGASAPVMSAPSGSMAATPSTANPAASLNPAQAAMSGLQAALTAAQTKDTANSAAIKGQQLPYAAAQAQAQVTQLQSSAKDLSADALKLSMDYNVGLANQQNILQNTRFQAQLQPILVREAELERDMRAANLVPQQELADFYKTPVGQIVLQGKTVREAGGEIPANAYMISKGLNTLLPGKVEDYGNPATDPSFDPNNPM